MIPSHGVATSVFMLANALRHNVFGTVFDWVAAARGKSAFLAQAIDHTPVADWLIAMGLVEHSEHIAVGPVLRGLSGQADRRTLRAIATLMLSMAPPPWLQVAVVDKVVSTDLIPWADLLALSWLEPDLEQILARIGKTKSSSPTTAVLGIGRAAELTVMMGLTALGQKPIHVADLSPAYGYDIESQGGPVREWEVKGCLTSTNHHFHLSRNEFNHARHAGPEWSLIQVEFDSTVLNAARVNRCHVRSIRILSGLAVVSMAPADTDVFEWETSAVFSPPVNLWGRSEVNAPQNLDLPPIVELAAVAETIWATALR